MPVRFLLAVTFVLACAPAVAAQPAVGNSITTVSAPQSIYIWKAETPVGPVAGTRYWRIQGAAGSAVDATKKTIGRVGGDGAALNAGMLDMFTNMLLKGAPIAPGFVPWSFVPEKAGDVCLIDKGKTPFDEPSVQNPSRFIANKEGGWANPSGADLVLFAPVVYPRADGAGLVFEGPFTRIGKTGVNILITNRPEPAIVVGTVRYPDDRWSPVGLGYAIKGGGLQFDSSGVWLMVGTRFTRSAWEEARSSSTVADAGADKGKSVSVGADNPAVAAQDPAARLAGGGAGQPVVPKDSADARAPAVPLDSESTKAMTDILAKADMKTFLGQHAAMGALADYAGANANATNASTITRFLTVVFSEVYGTSGRGFSPNGEDGFIVSFEIRKNKKKDSKIGSFQMNRVGGRTLAVCQLRVGEALASAYRIGRGSVVSPSLTAVENQQGTAAVRAGDYPDGTWYEATVPGEIDAKIRDALIWGAVDLGHFEAKKWIESKGGRRVAAVTDAPEGGYVVIKGAGKVTGHGIEGGTKVTWFGARFTPAVAQQVKAYRDTTGTVIREKVTAYTYEGLDGRFFTTAMASGRRVVMHGVWLDEAKRIAGDFTTEPSAFKVLLSR